MSQKAGELDEKKPGQQTDEHKADSGTDTGTSTENQGKDQTDSKKEPELTEDVKKLIQSREDTVRTKYTKDMQKLQKELDDLKKAQMTDDQRKSFEEQQKSDELTKKEQELTRKEQGILAGELFQEKGLPVDLRTYAIGNSEQETKDLVSKFETIWKRELKKAMETDMAKLGRKPNSGDPETTPTDIDAQIRQAEKKGDWRMAMNLKSKKSKGV